MNLKASQLLVTAFFFIISLFLIGTSSEGFENPEVDLKDVRIVGIDESAVDLEGILEIKNPNDLGARFAGYQYQLDVEGQHLSSEESHRPFQIPASGTVTLPIPARVLLDDLLALGKKGIFNRDLVYVLKGTVILDSKFGKFPLPFSHQGTFNLSDLLREKTRRFLQGF
jgi:LEA14-like dessication related protein